MTTLIYSKDSQFPKRINTRVSSARVKLRSMTSEKWDRLNFKLSENELAYDKTTRRLKIGDGVTFWRDLPYLVLDVSGNFNGIMTQQEFNAFLFAYGQFQAAQALKFDAQEAKNILINTYLVALDARLFIVEESGGGGSNGGGGTVDLSAYISTTVFNQYQAEQNTLNNQQDAKLNTIVTDSYALENRVRLIEEGDPLFSYVTSDDLWTYTSSQQTQNANFSNEIRFLKDRVTLCESRLEAIEDASIGNGVLIPRYVNDSVRTLRMAAGQSFTYRVVRPFAGGRYLMLVSQNNFHQSNFFQQTAIFTHANLKVEVFNEATNALIGQRDTAEGATAFFGVEFNFPASAALVKITNKAATNRTLFFKV